MKLSLGGPYSQGRTALHCHPHFALTLGSSPARDLTPLSIHCSGGGNIFLNECFLLPLRQYQGSKERNWDSLNQATHRTKPPTWILGKQPGGYKPEGRRGTWDHSWSFLHGSGRGAGCYEMRNQARGQRREKRASFSAELHTFSMRPLT